MKRDWEIDELLDTFTLSTEEWSLIHNKTAYNQLGFAALLKFFQYEGRFPHYQHEVPYAVLTYLAQQLEVEADLYDQYRWDGRTISSDRAIIRSYCRFREASSEDQAELLSWLLAHAEIKYEHPLSFWLELAYTYFREAKIEPLTPDQMERTVRSALNTHENVVCQKIFQRLSASHQTALLQLLSPDPEKKAAMENPWSRLAELKADPGPLGLQSILDEANKLRQLNILQLPPNLFDDIDPKLVHTYRQRAAAQVPSEFEIHPAAIRFTLLAAFCHERTREIVDNLVEMFNQIIHKINARAEYRVERELVRNINRVYGKNRILAEIAEAALANPTGSIRDVLFPVVSEKTLQNLIEEYRASGTGYNEAVYIRMRASYGRHYRRMLAVLLNTLTFRSNNEKHQPIIKALNLMRKYIDTRKRYYPDDEQVPIEGVVRPMWEEFVVEKRKRRSPRINRINCADFELYPQKRLDHRPVCVCALNFNNGS